MTIMEAGETVICSITVKNSAGTLVDPATSMNVQISNANGIDTAYTAMTNDAVGTYHYDWASSGKQPGKYTVRYKATDGARITIKQDEFELVA